MYAPAMGQKCVDVQKPTGNWHLYSQIYPNLLAIKLNQMKLFRLATICFVIAGLSKIVFRLSFCVASLHLKPSKECESSQLSQKTILKIKNFDFKSTASSKSTFYRLFALKNRPSFRAHKAGTL